MKTYKNFVKELKELEKERKKITKEIDIKEGQIVSEMIRIIYSRVKELGGKVSFLDEDYEVLDNFQTPVIVIENWDLDWLIEGIFIEDEDIMINIFDEDREEEEEAILVTTDYTNDDLLQIIEFLETLTPDIMEELKAKKESGKFNF